jgi:hypothetical protein
MAENDKQKELRSQIADIQKDKSLSNAEKSSKIFVKHESRFCYLIVY